MHRYTAYDNIFPLKQDDVAYSFNGPTVVPEK
jgi:hypothetical protein